MGERQTGKTVSDIRADHANRYLWAARRLPPKSRVLDCCCGVGYGASILAEHGHTVAAFDRSPGAIEDAQRYFGHPGVRYFIEDIADVSRAFGLFDAAICFEAIEHIPKHLEALADIGKTAPRLIGSVPNELTIPFNPQRFPYHVRHFKPAEIEDLLNAAGWQLTAAFRQRGPFDPVEHYPRDGFASMIGRTIVFEADLT